MDSITKSIEVFTRNAPAADGANVRANVHNGLMAVGSLFSFVTGARYPACLSDGSPIDKMRGVVPFYLDLKTEPPRVMLDILETVAQRVFDQVANGEAEASVLAVATGEIEREFAKIPGSSEQ